MATIEDKYDYIGEFHQGIAIVVKNGKYGAILTGGNEIISPSYDYIASFEDGCAEAVRQGECIVIDLSGRECKKYDGKLIAIPSKYDMVRDFKNGYACVKKDGKWGVIDTECNEIFEPQFYFISDFIGGSAKYKYSDTSYWGFVNSNGYCSESRFDELQIEPNGNLIVGEYESSLDENGCYIQHLSRRYRINNKGQLLVKDGDNIVALPKEFQYARDFISGIACVQNSTGYWGAINKDGRIIVPFEYKRIQNFSENKTFGINKSDKLCLISLSGSVMKTFENYTNAESFKNGFAIVYNENQQGLINPDGAEVIKPIPGFIHYTETAGKFNITSEKTDGKRGLYDASTGILLLPYYDSTIEILSDCLKVEINQFGECFVDYNSCAFIGENPRVFLPSWCIGAKKIADDLYLGITLDRKCGLLNSTGDILCPPTFDNIVEIKDNIIIVESHEIVTYRVWYEETKQLTKYGLYNISTKLFIPAVYDLRPEPKEYFYKVSQDGLFGALDLEGNEVIKTKWKDVYYEKGYFIVSQKEKDNIYDNVGLANNKGKLIYEPKFHDIRILEKGLYKMCKRYSWYLYNDEGQLSLDYFDEMSSIKNGLIEVKKNGLDGRIDLNGNKVVLSENGDIIELPPRFSWGQDFMNGIAKVWIKDYENYVDRAFNLIINNNGTVIPLNIEVDYLVSKDCNGNYIYAKDGKYGVLSNEGRVLIDAQYVFLTNFSNGLFIAGITKVDQLELYFGVIDINKNEILGFDYTSITAYEGIVPEYFDPCYINCAPDQIKVPESVEYWLVYKSGFGLADANENVFIMPDYRDIRQFGNGFFVRNGFKWGLADKNGKFFMLPEYDEIRKSDNGFFVKIDNKWGIIDKEYVPLCEPKYDTITDIGNGYYKVSNIISIDYYKKNEKFGILDQYGQEKIKPIYQYIGDVNDDADGLASIKLGNKFGLVDNNYDIIAEPQYEQISQFINGRATASKRIAKEGFAAGVIIHGELDVNGNFIESKDSENSDITNDNIKCLATLKNGYKVIQKDNNTGSLFQYCAIVDANNNVVLPYNYQRIEELENGMLLLYIQKEYGGRFGLLDNNLNEIVAPEYGFIRPIQEVFIVSKCGSFYESHDLVGLMNCQGEIILPLNYSSIKSAAPGLLWIYKDHGEKVGLVSTGGRVLLEPIEGKAEPFINGFAKINKGHWYDEEDEDGHRTSREYSEGPWSVINTDGEEVVPPLYYSINLDIEHKCFLVSKPLSVLDESGQYKKVSGRLNLKGEHIIKNADGLDIIASDKYDWQDDFDEKSTSVVYHNGDTGVVNADMQLLVSIPSEEDSRFFVLPDIYDWGCYTSEGYIKIEKEYKYGIINKDGIVIIDCVYDNIKMFFDDSDIIFICGKLEENQHKYQSSFNWNIYNGAGEKILSSSSDEINVLGYSLISVKTCNGKYSIINYRGQKVNNTLFDEIKTFGISTSKDPKYSWNKPQQKEGLRYAIVGVDGKYGLIDRYGQIVIVPKYNTLTIQDNNTFIANETLINVFGQRIVAKDGNIVILPDGYENAEILPNGLLIVKKDDLYGCINKKGKTIIPFEYKSLSCFGNLLSATIYDNANNVNKQGVINLANTPIIPFSNQFSDFKIDNYIIRYKQGSHWGAYTHQGKIICEAIYDYIVCVTDNLYKVGMNGHSYDTCYNIEWNNEKYDFTNYRKNAAIDWGLIDSDGNEILPLQYSAIADKVVNGLIEIIKGNSIGFIDVTGQILLTPTYDKINNFIDGYAIVSKISSFYYGHGDKYRCCSYGVINSSFDEILPCVFDSIEYESETGLFKTDVGYKTAGGKFLSEVNGKRLFVNEKYKYCKEFVGDCAIAEKVSNGDISYGLINSRSEDILPPIFEKLELLDNGLYKYKINGKYGLTDSSGNIILSNKYDGIGNFKDNLALVLVKVENNNETVNLYGFIDSTGNEILPSSYNFIGKRFNKYHVVMKDNVWGLFNIESHKLNMMLNASYLGPCMNNLFRINVGGGF